MTRLKAPVAAVSFFASTDQFLNRFLPFGPIDVGIASSQNGGNEAPQWVFLNDANSVDSVLDLLQQHYPPPVGQEVGAWLKQEPGYDKLLTTKDGAKLVPIDDADFEIGDGHSFTFQVILHNTCHGCDAGVAARVKYSFDNSGQLKTIDPIGLCQEPLITETVPGSSAPIMVHRGTGLDSTPNGGLVENKSVFVAVPGLPTCPDIVK